MRYLTQLLYHTDRQIHSTINEGFSDGSKLYYLLLPKRFFPSFDFAAAVTLLIFSTRCSFIPIEIPPSSESSLFVRESIFRFSQVELAAMESTSCCPGDCYSTSVFLNLSTWFFFQALRLLQVLAYHLREKLSLSCSNLISLLTHERLLF